MALLLCPGAVDGSGSRVQGVHEVQELQVKHHIKQHTVLKYFNKTWSLLFPKPMLRGSLFHGLPSPQAHRPCRTPHYLPQEPLISKWPCSTFIIPSTVTQFQAPTLLAFHCSFAFACPNCSLPLSLQSYTLPPELPFAIQCPLTQDAASLPLLKDPSNSLTRP